MRHARLGLVCAACVLGALVFSCAEGSTLSGDAEAAGSTGSPAGSGGAGGTSGSGNTSGSNGSGSNSGSGGGSGDCPDDDHEPAESCAAAKAMGQVTDANATALEISGTLTDATDEDWYSFETLDSDEVTTNSYHVSIVFTSPAGVNDEFSFDVLRGGACGSGDARHSDLKTYDWCVDDAGTLGDVPIGEAICGTATAPCGNHSKPYLLRVHRDPQFAYSAGTCATYTLSITAKGSGQCDFTGNCDPQVSESP
jgi:hypothetical protein